MTLPATGDFLKSVSIFSLLEREEIEKISSALRPVEAAKGTVLFRQGDEGRELYIVESGCIASSIELPDGGNREIALFRPGDFFGEMSIFEEAPRSATCSAKEDSILLRLRDRDFFSVIDSYPLIAIKIMYRMLNIVTQRLEKTGAFLSDMVTWGEQARRRAITDELTGVYNRRFLEDVIPDYLRSAQANQSELTLIMVDLDRFREINESYGNQMGDRAIIEVVSVFRRHLSEKDIIARYGGDEFTVMLPGTGMARATEIATAICEEVRRLTFLQEAGGAIDRITTSQGIASFPESAVDLRSLRVAADEALYRAKEAGKDRVMCAASRK